MLKPKIIFIDGITGSGKSTTAHYLTRQLGYNSYKAKWLFEYEIEHPLATPDRNEAEPLEAYLKRITDETQKKWREFSEQIKSDDTVYVVECYFFQNLMWNLLADDFSKTKIKSFLHSLYSILSGIEIAVIFFYQNDIDKAIRKNWEKRGEEWKKECIEDVSAYRFCHNRYLTGEATEIGFFLEMNKISLEIMDELNFTSIKIENTDQAWPKYRTDILELINLPEKVETLFKPSYNEYCGVYGKGEVHIKNNRLCMNLAWPNMPLVPVGKDKFALESYPRTYQFIRDENDEIIAHRVIQDFNPNSIGIERAREL